MEHLKLLSITLVLTVLIWITADSLVNETATVGVEFSVVPAPGNPDMVVTSTERSLSHQVQLSGPRKVIAQVQAASPLAVRIQVPDKPTGDGSIDLKIAMENQWKEYPKLNVLSVVPPELLIKVDHMVTRELRLEVKEQLALQYDVRPQLDRSTILLRMPESHFADFQASGRPLRVSVDPERVLEEQPRGQAVEVPLTLVPSEWGFPEEAALLPATVTVSATVKADRVTREIGTVPILLATSFANFGTPLRAVPPDGGILVTRTITVTGPARLVERMIRGERPVGIVRLKEEHLERPGVQQSFIPEFHLPPGVELAQDPQPVVFTLSPASGT